MIYKGPFLKVLDDDGHAMERGKRYAVCDKTFQLYNKAPYRSFSNSSARASKSPRTPRPLRLHHHAPAASEGNQGPGLPRHHRGLQLLRLDGTTAADDSSAFPS